MTHGAPGDPGAALIAELPALRRYARALVGAREAADDLVQDTLERAWTRRHQRRIGGNARAWLFSIMHNLRIDQLRRARAPLVEHDGELPEVAARAAQGDGLDLRDLDRALRRLPEEQRAVLLLVGLEGMSYEQTAAALDLPVGTVMSRLSRARRRLKDLIDEPAAPVALRVVQ